MALGTAAAVLATAGSVVGASRSTAGLMTASSKELFTLTVTFVGREVEREYATAARPELGVRKGFVYEEARRRTSYVAHSATPFALTPRASGAGTFFQLRTQLEGTLVHSGTGRRFAGILGCYERFTETARTLRVWGEVSLSGAVRNPAPLLVDLEPPSSRNAVTRMYRSSGCEGSKGRTEAVSTLLPQARRWSGPLGSFSTRPLDLGAPAGRPLTVVHRDRHTRVSDVFDLKRRKSERTYEWVFTFVPVKQVETQRWRVEVLGTDRWSWGRTAVVGAGVVVEWKHATEFAVDGGKVTTKKSTVTLVGTKPFSQPDGVFAVTHRSKAYGAYEPTLRLLGKRVELVLWNDPGSTYRADFTVKLAGAQALDRLRAARVPDPDALYRDLARGRAVQSTFSPLVPAGTRLVVKLAPGLYQRDTEAFSAQLPCTKGATAKECYRERGGETVTVRRVG